MTDLSSSRWLQSYYYTRAAVSVLWVTAAFTIGKAMPLIGAALLVGYPAWDALANFADAQRSGGLKANPTQSLNVVISSITTLAVAGALTQSPYAVSAVFGVWAALSGLMQLATGVRRWSDGAQWAMVLSGAQSTLAGLHFIQRAAGTVPPDVATVAPYAAFGAFYFLVSAVWLTVAMKRRHAVERAT